MTASITTLVSFNGSNGGEPQGSLIADAAGNLYGTTQQGGANSEGTVFEIAKGSNTATPLVSFNNTNGAYPYGSLITDAAGNLYGTTEGGGPAGVGAVFEIAKGSNTAATLVSFNYTNGAYPTGSLIADAAGDLYGTTSQGGANGYGEVFEIAKGSNIATALVSFDVSSGDDPRGSLIADAAGNLYGTTADGGTNGDGAVFEISGSGFVVPVVSITSPAVVTATAVQTIAGTVTDLNPGVSVAIYDNGATTALGTATVAADGTWSTNVTLVGLGNHSLVATATDTAGNTGSSTAEVDTLIDTQPPVLSSVTETVSGMTAGTTDIISGDVTDNYGVAGVAVYDGTTDLGAATITGGTWTYTASGLLDGSHSFSAVATDTSGNTSQASAGAAMVVDTVPPSIAFGAEVSQAAGTPGLSSDIYNSEGYFNDQPSWFASNTPTSVSTVTSISNANVPTTTDYRFDGYFQPNSTGTYSFRLASDDSSVMYIGTPGQTLVDLESHIQAGTALATYIAPVVDDSGQHGTNTVTATASVAAGSTYPVVIYYANNGGPGNIVFTYATPLAPSTFSGDLSDEFFASAPVPAANPLFARAGNLVSETFTVSPSTFGGAAVVDSVTIDGHAATVTAGAGNTYTAAYTVQSGDQNGLAAVTITAHDAAGNSATSTTAGTVTIDTVAPVLTAVEAVSGLNKFNSDSISGHVTDLNPGTSVQITDGGAALGTATIAADGTWSYNAAGLAVGVHSFAATTTDEAGNSTTTSAGASVTVDTTPPTLAATESISALTKQTSDTISGTVSDLNGVHGVEIYDGTTDLGAATITGANWSYTASSLADGSHSFTAVATDDAGNATAALSAGAAVVVDTTAPVVSITSPAVVTDNAVQTIAGTVTDLHPGSTVSIFDNGSATALATATIGAGGAWSTSVTLPGNGINSLVAEDTDLAGNTGSSAALIDVLGPPPVVTLQAHPAADNASNAALGTAVTAYLNDALSVTLTSDADYTTGSHLALVGTNLIYTPGLVTTAQVGTDTIAYTVTDTVSGAVTLETQTVTLDNTPNPAITLAATPVADNTVKATLGTAVPGVAGDALSVSLTSDHVFASGSSVSLVNGTLLYTPGLVTHADVGVDSITYTVTDDVTGAMTTQTETIRLSDSYALIGFGGNDIVNLGGYNNFVTGPSAPAASNGENGPTIVGAPYGGTLTIGTANSETITAQGYNNTIVGNGGDDTINAGQGSANVTVSDANGNNTVTGSQGNTSISLGNGNNTINLGGYNNTITLGDGINTVVAGAGSETVDIAGGSANVQAGGWGDVFNFGGGDYVLGGMDGTAIVNLAWSSANAATDSLDLKGTAGDIFNFSNGELLVTSPNGANEATIHATGGAALGYAADGNGGTLITFGGNGLTGPAIVAPTQPTDITEIQGGVTLDIAANNEILNLTGYNNSITGGSGNVAASGSQGGTNFVLGNGNETLGMAGYNNTVVLGNGNSTISAGEGNEKVSTGTGDNTISANGYGNVISTTAGTNTITAGAGNATVNTWAANDTVTLSGWNNLVTGGAGADVITGGQGNDYQLTSLSATGGFDITDFNAGNYDVLDLSKVTAGLPPGWTLGGTVVGSALDVTLTSGGSNYLVATLHGAGSNGLAGLIASHQIIA